MITEDKDLVEAVMDGSNVFVGRFAHTLRVELLMEHLGFEKEQVIDPLNPELIEKMNSMAKVSNHFYFVTNVLISEIQRFTESYLGVIQMIISKASMRYKS